MRKSLANTRKVAFVGVVSSLALLLSYVEFLLPPVFVAVPGIKLGLPNVVILYVLYTLGLKYATLVSFVRIVISSHLFGGFMAFSYSVAGAILSLLLMALLKKTDKFSEVGVSVAGGIAHNIGQVLVAMVLLDTPQIAFYLLILSVTGTIAGIFVGLCGAFILKRLPIQRLWRA